MDPKENNEDKEGKDKKWPAGTGIGVGIAIGVGIGTAIGNVGAGIAIGVAIGAGMEQQFCEKPASTPEKKNLTVVLVGVGILVLALLAGLYFFMR